MQRVVVASTNPVKINAVREGFVRMFPDESFEFEGITVPSGVSDQPMTDEETYTGAMNRAVAAEEHVPEADFWVGLEGGIEEHHSGGLCVFGWLAVRSRTGKCGRGRTAAFFLPQAVADLVHQGFELGTADDQVFGRENSKQANGATGILTMDAVTRTDQYSQAMVLALIPFKNKDLF